MIESECKVDVDVCVQRPTAKELLKHKFVKTAKKANYLTELIERHDKWKVDTGGKREDREDNHSRDNSYVKRGFYQTVS
jgi:hypothetical protein